MDVKKKKLLYLSSYRGTKETDILIGSFAKMYLSDMNREEVAAWESILRVEDSSIYQWLVMNEKAPKACESTIGRRFKSFVDGRWAK